MQPESFAVLTAKSVITENFGLILFIWQL